MQSGTPAPSFTASSYLPFTKEMVKIELACLRGTYTVLIFYPGDFRPLVLSELKGFQEAANELLNEINVLAISTDTVESHQAFAELRQEEGGLEGLCIILVEDKTGDISRDYQVYDMATHQALPTYIIIDDEGEVVASISNSYNIGGNPHEVVRIVKACMMCDEEGAWSEVKGTPSDWQPGMELVTGVLDTDTIEVLESEDIAPAVEKQVDDGEATEEKKDDVSSFSGNGWKFWAKLRLIIE